MKRTIFLLAVSQAIMMTCTSLLITTAALVGDRLASDKSLATLPLALQFLATMSVAVPASLLMQKAGRRPAFILGTMVGAGGALTAYFAIAGGSFFLFCVATALVGASNGFGIYYRFAAADVASDEYRSRAISYVLAGGIVAAFAGPNLANLTRNVLEVEFAGSYGALLVLYAVSAASLFFATGLRPPQAMRQSGRPLGTIARQPKFVVALIGAMLGYGIMSLVMTATPLAMKGCGFPFDDTAFVIQWHVFAMFAPSFFTGHLIKRFGVLNIMLAGALLNGACVAVNLTGETVLHYWVALFMLGLGWNFLFIGGTTLLTETYSPEEQAKTQALNDFLVFTIVSVASLSAGALQYQVGWRAVNLGVVPLIAVILIAVLWLKRRPAAAPVLEPAPRAGDA